MRNTTDQLSAECRRVIGRNRAKARNAGHHPECTACKLILFCIGGPPDQIMQCRRCGMTDISEVKVEEEYAYHYSTVVGAVIGLECPCAFPFGMHKCVRSDEKAFRRGRIKMMQAQMRKGRRT